MLAIRKKEMNTYKKLQNLDLNTYDKIFSEKQFCGKKIRDFSSFKELLNNIKTQFNSDLLTQQNIKNIQDEGKFSFDKYNITRIKFLDDENFISKISINNRYIHSDSKSGYFYLTKSIFKKKHCFEFEIRKMANFEFSVGLININYIDKLKESMKDNNNKIVNNNMKYIQNFANIKLENPILIKQNNKDKIHYILYGDIIGVCYNFDEKLLYLYLNGEIISTHELNLETGANNSFIPIIFIGKFEEIIFNPGENLKYVKNYKKMGFIPR